mgnify:CR=1 FL=1
MKNELIVKYKGYLYFVFRILVGLLFFTHGIQKFGLLGGSSVDLISLMGLAGTIEILVGALIVIGFLTRIAALIGAIEMLVAYFMAHLPSGLNPLTNQGEPALLFFVAFLVLMGYGSVKWPHKP